MLVVLGCLEAPAETSLVYRLKSGDRILLRITSVPNPQQIEDVIDSTGSVTLPYLGSISISNKTVEEAEAHISHLFVTNRIYTSPSVQVTRLMVLGTNTFEVIRGPTVFPERKLDRILQGDFWLPGEYEKALEDKTKEQKR